MASRLVGNISKYEIRTPRLDLSPGETATVGAPLTDEEIKLVSRNQLSDAATADPALITWQQAFIPVTEDNEIIVGFFAAPNDTYDGTETTLILSAGSVPIELYVLPETNTKNRQERYMRCQYPNHVDNIHKEWQSYIEFVPMKDVMPEAHWQNTATVQRRDHTDGALIDALIMGSSGNFTLIPTPPPVVTTPGSLSIVANAPFANEPGIKFFDFNWVEVFQASFPTTEPATIIVTSQPAEGDFKAFVIRNAQPVKNMLILNTIRIVKTKTGNVPAGNRAFAFTINDHLGNTTNVVLNVTVS